jgi:hypothetical protein
MQGPYAGEVISLADSCLRRLIRFLLGITNGRKTGVADSERGFPSLGCPSPSPYRTGLGTVGTIRRPEIIFELMISALGTGIRDSLAEEPRPLPIRIGDPVLLHRRKDVLDRFLWNLKFVSEFRRSRSPFVKAKLETIPNGQLAFHT